MSSTAPVSKNGFHFANGELRAEASNSNRHRRATLPELQALFHPPPGHAAPKDPPPHWYEAQLLHYGLQSSKTKGTAAKRLLDALNRVGLEVPKQVSEVEKALKREWEGNERKARKDMQQEQGKSGGSATSKGKKRKAETQGESSSSVVGGMNFTFNFNMGGAGGGPSLQVEESKPSNQKAKTESTAASTTKKEGKAKATAPKKEKS